MAIISKCLQCTSQMETSLRIEEQLEAPLTVYNFFSSLFRQLSQLFMECILWWGSDFSVVTRIILRATLPLLCAFFTGQHCLVHPSGTLPSEIIFTSPRKWKIKIWFEPHKYVCGYDFSSYSMLSGCTVAYLRNICRSESLSKTFQTCRSAQQSLFL